ncbi:Hypothetical protein SRAE_1000061800 [Strongyloides ratti]|uniref:Uncharacterized protein n=1 Tax=Strongyloides ratti TaxID=34506 RepID=A0A090KXV1_STRRB|nr:Hypothetical protein SRAE_1000061800 [Strongyloides ratti]CEF62345.1 Hypothetical protein SRAE_1000061800 [Strongyloides ratti]
MFDQNLSLIQPGGDFNIIWVSGDPMKKKLTPKLRKLMVDCNLNVILSQLRPYIFNFQKGIAYDKTFMFPLNVVYRLIYGILECLDFSLNNIEKKLEDLTSIEMRLLHIEEKLKLFGHQISQFHLEDDTDDDDEEVVRKKRKYESPIFDDHNMEELFQEATDIEFGQLEVDKPVAEFPTSVIRHFRTPTTSKSIEEIGGREKRKREFTELFDIISEVGRTNEDVIEVAREAFSSNPILSEAFEKRISGAYEVLDEFYDMILDDKAAQTELYLQKLKLVEQNVINDECIAQISKESGRRFSIKADTIIPSDIYTELTSIAMGKSTLFAKSSTPGTIREEGHEQIDTPAHDVGKLSFVPEISDTALEESGIQLPEKGSPVGPEHVEGIQHQIEEGTEAVPVIQQPTRKRRKPQISRSRQQRQRSSSSLDVVTSMQTLEDIFQFFNSRQASFSLKITRKIKAISKFCENFVLGLATQRESFDIHEYMKFSFWFKNLENISEEIYKNNGCLINMFEKLQTLPFDYSDNGFIIESEYKNELKEILDNFKVSKIDCTLYAAIVDMPIIGLCNDQYNSDIIRTWLQSDGLNEPSSQMSSLSDYNPPSGESYNLLPKYLPKTFMYLDFTYSLKTLRNSYEKLRYSFLKKMGQDRDLYRRHGKFSKKVKKFVWNDVGSWNFIDNVGIVEKMIKDVVLSDNLLTSTFYNLQSLDEESGVTTKLINTFLYNPNGTIVWSDLTLFIDSILKVYYEDEDSRNVEFANIKEFVDELYCPSQRKTFFQEAVESVEFESRLQEIHNSLVSIYSEPENYFYNKSNEKVFSQFEHLMPMIVEEETSISDEIDMEDILDDLDTFELDLFLGHVPPYNVVEEEFKEKTFNNVESLYNTYINNEEDLRVKLYADIQITMPSKWDDALTNYSRKDRKRHNVESSSVQEKPKRQRVSVSLPTVPEGELQPDEGKPEEIPIIPVVEELPEVGDLGIEKLPPGGDSTAFKDVPHLTGEDIFRHSEGSLTFKETEEMCPQIEKQQKESEILLEESVLPLPSIVESERKDLSDVTLPPPEFSQEQLVSEISELYLEPSVGQLDVISEKRKEVEELLKRCDVVPEYHFTFPVTGFRYGGRKKNIITDNVFLKNAAYQIGSTELLDSNDNEVSSDNDTGLGISDLFTDISLNDYPETSMETYEKAKRLAGDSEVTTFKKLVGDSPTRASVAKIFYNTVILARNNKYLSLCQKDSSDIKITVYDPPGE